MPFLGSGGLYRSEILEQGKYFEGLIIAIPWFSETPKTQSFAKKAFEKWHRPVSWDMASSYDATQALIQALISSDFTRASVLEKLKSINLSPKETSGYPLKFKNHEREGAKPVLVKVAKNINNNGDKCIYNTSGYHFELVDENQIATQ